MKQVAAELGVSIPTVSQALHGTGGNTRISEEVRQRIIQTAASIGYRPNAQARATRTGRSQAIALLLGADPERSNLPAAVQDAICARLATRDMHLVFSRMSDQDLTSEHAIPRILQELVVDGLLVNYTHASPKPFHDLLTRFHIPAVWLNHKREMDCVYPDEVDAGRLATQHLLDLGHRRIVMVDFLHPAESDRTRWHYSVEDRYAGYAAAMAAARLPAERILRPGGGRHGRGVIRALLAGADRPTAAVCYHPENAYLLALTAAELGLSVPHDLSLVSFSERSEMALDIPMTCALIPAGAMGVAGVDALLQKISNPNLPMKPVCLSFALDRGATTAAPMQT